jgi:hypothetical protein
MTTERNREEGLSVANQRLCVGSTIQASALIEPSKIISHVMLGDGHSPESNQAIALTSSINRMGTRGDFSSNIVLLTRFTPRETGQCDRARLTHVRMERFSFTKPLCESFFP